MNLEEQGNTSQADMIEAFEERAAIMEYDGGLTRAEAEKEAERIVYEGK